MGGENEQSRFPVDPNRPPGKVPANQDLGEFHGFLSEDEEAFWRQATESFHGPAAEGTLDGDPRPDNTSAHRSFGDDAARHPDLHGEDYYGHEPRSEG